MRSITQRFAALATILLASYLLTHAHAQGWGSDWTPMKDATPTASSDANTNINSPESTGQVGGESQGRNYAVHERDPIYSNDTDINSVIEQIINSRREGRNLGEFDQVYADGNIDQALQMGNDMQARNLIREKLCGLGLMSCEVEEKRPFYSTIYAQGPPPPGFGGGPYGPPRPMPPPSTHHFNSRPPPPPPSSLNSFGPPRKVGYEGPFKPNYRPSGPGPMYNGPYLENPPPSALDGSNGPTFSKPPPGAIIYGSKPPGPVYQPNQEQPPYHFEQPTGAEKIQVASSQHNNFYAHQAASSAASSSSNLILGNALPPPQSGAAAAAAAAASAGLQQHVHHHFHHVEGTDNLGPGAGIKVPTVPIPIGGGQAINTDFTSLAQSSTAFTPQTQSGFAQSSAFEAGFNGASHGGLLSQGANAGFGGLTKPNGDLYKPTAGLNNFGSYHSQNPDYYKKELQNFGGLGGNFNGISTGYSGQGQGLTQGQFGNGFETARQQIVDCQCVPFNQCPAADRIGRKEDLILPIDPRNLGKDIEALSDEPASNTTVTAEAKSDEQKPNSEEPKKDASRRRRREIQAEDKQSDEGDLSLDAEGRQAAGGVGAGLGSVLPFLQAIELVQRKVLPTYGISFGLPAPSTGGYPTNALGDYYPAKNPHFGAIGPDGLNLGLVNVNPLVSVQVSKTEFGDKVVKPLVNLHVTPNANILEKVGNLFKTKPEYIHNTHYHHHDHHSGDVIELDHHPHYQHHHHDGAIVEHFPSTGPFTDIEMIPSKPIFEYHSSLAIPPQIITSPQHYHHHYSTSAASTLGQTAVGGNFYPQSLSPGTGSAGSLYPSTATGSGTGVGFGSYPSYGNAYGYGSTGLSTINGNFYERSSNITQSSNSKYEEFNVDSNRRGKQLKFGTPFRQVPTQAPGAAEGSSYITFPKDRRRRRSTSVTMDESTPKAETINHTQAHAQERAYYGNRPVEKTCRINEVCCRRPFRPQAQQQPQFGRCGVRNAAGITGRIKNPVYVDGDSEFGEYPWHVAILKKDPKESIYACGGTLIDAQHLITAAHCIKSQNGFDLRARLGEWDVNHDVEFFPYIERDVVSVHIHPEYYAGTLDNDLAVLKLDHPVDFTKNPHISPACLPDKFSDFTGARCWTTGWGKDAFGEHGKYQNILKEVDVPILSHHQCETQLRQTRLGYSYKLNPGFLCAGGEEGKDACKGDGGGPLVCERNGVWNVVGVVSWGIGCGQVNVPGVYVRVAHYLDWIRQITQYYK